MLCQFLVLAGKSFWFKYACTTKSSSRLGQVVLLCQFLVLASTTEKKVLVICLAGCAVVSVFGSGDYDRNKKF